MLTGKHIAVTGVTSGIGRVSAIELARQGAELTLFYRSREKVDSLCDELRDLGAPEPTLVAMDMASLDSVRAAATEVLANGRPIDVLLNNAGIVNLKRRETVDGFEETLAVNHFAPFLLTGMLLPLVRGAGNRRIVNVASEAHGFVRGMHFEDMQATTKYRVFREYGRSKLANILFTTELARRLENEGVTVNCLHPGAVATSLGKQNSGFSSRVLPALLKPFFLTPEQGAATSLYLCTSAEVDKVTGAYFIKSRQRPLRPWAADRDAAQTLWHYTEDCLNFSYPV